MPYTVGIYTLGCKVSQYESIAIAEGFEALGFTVLPFEEPCDVYVINTCTVTAESDRKCRQIIRRAAKRNAVVLVCGCYSQVSKDEVASIDGVKYVGGNYNKNKIPEIALELLLDQNSNTTMIDVTDIDTCGFEKMCIHSAPRTRVYVKIEDGCESRCTYCIIPSARGRIRSKEPADIIKEIRGLAASGVREVVLTGIETASYGRDLVGVTLIDIIEQTALIDGIKRIRLGSLDPSSINEDFVIRASKLPKFARHFHLSMQSGSSAVLARMKRKYNAKQAMSKIRLIRQYMPDAAFTTDMMVGFPSESEAEFAETCDFAREAKFLFMHIFPYSRRKGTPAAEYGGQIPEQIKHERARELGDIRDMIADEVRRELLPIGTITEVLFETYDDGYMKGHTANFVEVRVRADRDMHGEIHRTRITNNANPICEAELI
ncbi:MAG: tRNA (N(6)-L-threonylcarbamoyladenosine(37)-C(2))-methylthiotransferase MtaB [Clostridia bacterium]|nr:tRNA (N(6)-L-threonylcarbamoyladenosine(37)-C(2))-methylthiotransferase MtaB [Clostridia bacterium]